MGLDEKLRIIINEAEKEAQHSPLYPEAQHNTFSQHYPDGEVAYYKNEKHKLLCEIPNRSLIGNAWVNSNTPICELSSLVNTYHSYRINDKFRFGNQHISEDAYIDFAKEDSLTFFRDYYAWVKINDKINELISSREILDPTGINSKYTFYDAIISEDKDKIISIIKSIISSSTTRKNIAILLYAMEKENIVIIENISYITQMWYATFGYRSELKSLYNGLSEYLTGDLTKFANKNRRKIEAYRSKFR